MIVRITKVLIFSLLQLNGMLLKASNDSIDNIERIRGIVRQVHLYRPVDSIEIVRFPEINIDCNSLVKHDNIFNAYASSCNADVISNDSLCAFYYGEEYRHTIKPTCLFSDYHAYVSGGAVCRYVINIIDSSTFIAYIGQNSLGLPRWVMYGFGDYQKIGNTITIGKHDLHTYLIVDNNYLIYKDNVLKHSNVGYREAGQEYRNKAYKYNFSYVFRKPTIRELRKIRRKKGRITPDDLYPPSIIPEEERNILYSTGMECIEDSAFLTQIWLRELVFPDNISSIGKFSFYDCVNLRNVILPDSLKIIDEFAFANCASIDTLRLKEKVDTIGQYVFFNCIELKHITLSKNIKVIPKGAFQQCGSLDNVVIPASVESIEEFVFLACSSLRTVVSENSDPPRIREYTFDVNNRITVFVPEGSVEAYKAHELWGKMNIKTMSELKE